MTNEVTDLRILLNNPLVCSIGKLQIKQSTITLLSGKSFAGKTATCLTLSNEVISNKQRVLYFDTEDKLLNRPEPNLFKDLIIQNKENYLNLFFHIPGSDLEGIFQKIDKVNPHLLVIDSLFYPFYLKYPSAMARAKQIKQFLIVLRGMIISKKITCILTTQVGKLVNPSTGEWTISSLGGDSLLYFSDLKYTIHFPDKGAEKNDELCDIRFFVESRKERVTCRILENGFVESL